MRFSTGTSAETEAVLVRRSPNPLRRVKGAAGKTDCWGMERASARRRIPRPLDAAVFAAAVHAAAHEASREDEPVSAIDAAVASLHDAVDGLFPSVFVLEHGHLWLVAQRGYAVVPDGIGVEQGVVGRAVRLGRGQLVIDVRSDPDYLEVLPNVVSEATVPLRVDRVTVGVLDLGCERPLPAESLKLLRPLAAALAPKTAILRASGRLDLPALARLFVYLGSLRDPNEIATLASASFARVLRLDATQVWMWDDVGRPVELASWRAEAAALGGLTVEELESARRLVDPALVHQLVDVRGPESQAEAPRGDLASAEGERRGHRRAPRHRRRCREHREPRYGGRARGSHRGLARCRARAPPRAPERRHRRAHGHPQPARARGTSRARGRRRPGAAPAAQRARPRLRRLQGHQRPRGTRVRRRAPPGGRRRAHPFAPRERRGGASRRRRVRRHAAGRRRGSRRGARCGHPERPRGRADRSGVPAPSERRHRHLPVRRCDPDCAPARSRPGALLRQGRGEGSRRVVPRRRHPRRVRADGGGDDRRERAACGAAQGRLGALGRSRRRSRARSGGDRRRGARTGSARPSSSSSARPAARPRASSVRTSSTQQATRCASSHSARRPRTGSRTFRSPPRRCASASRGPSRSSRRRSIRRRRSSSASSA